MIVTIGGIPVYDAMILDKESGMMRISLVDDPAVMSNFQSFDTTKKMQMYSVTDEEKRIIIGCVMRCDFPIYRRDKEMGEYYIIYKADTIRVMAEKYLTENRQNLVNLMHEDGSDVDGVQMVQYFIKDSSKGIAPEGYDDIADGSLFAEFHVTNDEVWNAIKEGTYQGFSLEGYFDLQPETDSESVEEIVDSLDGKFNRIFKQITNSKTMSKLTRLKAALLAALERFGNITTDKGVLSWDGDDDIKAGDSVFIEDADGNRIAPEDGDYKTEDGKTIKVADGKVTEIVDPEAEVNNDPTEETMGSKTTDKGNILWDGDEDLKEGDEVFVEKDGERVPAEDGEYITEDGKVINVADGKVVSITDKEAEVAPEDGETENKSQTKMSRIREAFEDSYEEKERRIMDAVSATFAEGEAGYLVEAGDGYAIVNIYTEDNWDGRFVKYEVSWDEEGNVILGASEEVKTAFIPVDDANPNDTTSEEMESLRKENEELKSELEKFKKTPAAKAAHEEVVTSFSSTKTGDKKLDRLSRLAALAAQAKSERR